MRVTRVITVIVAVFAAALVLMPPAQAKAKDTVIVGWDAPQLSVNAGSLQTQRVKILSGGKGVARKAELWRLDATTGVWMRVKSFRTDSRGRAAVVVPTQQPGQWLYEVRAPRVTGYRAFRLPMRIVDVASVANPPSAEDLLKHLPSDVPRGATRIWVTGDLGWPTGVQPREMAKLLSTEKLPTFLTGDIAYPSGTMQDYLENFDPWFGSMKDRLFPVPGNHDYRSGGDAYFSYFGPRVGTKAEPWYTVKVGAWTFFMLNSNCSNDASVGCQPGSVQYEWLRQQLEANSDTCTAAVVHHPRISSGETQNNGSIDAIFDLLADHGTDLYFAGHEHFYERFVKLDANLEAASTGMRQFIVGTGGAELLPITNVGPFSEQRVAGVNGAIKLDLTSTGYTWEFVPTEPGYGTDYGTDTCSP